MSEAEHVFDKRIQAAISADLKDRVRDLVKDKRFESEAEIVRLALSRFVDNPVAPVKHSPSDEPGTQLPFEPPHSHLPVSMPVQHNQPPDDNLHRDLKGRMDLIAWLLTVGLMLIATIATKLFRLLGDKETEPMQLIDQTVQASVHDRSLIRQKLAVGWQAFNQAGGHHHNGNGANPDTPK
jgi:hypothetical protein